MARSTRYKFGVKHLYSFASQDVGQVMKMSVGHCVITGSRDVDTGLDQVISMSANVTNMSMNAHGPWMCTCRVPKPGGAQVAARDSKGAGYGKILVLTSNASVEAGTAASVDWMAIGT